MFTASTQINTWYVIWYTILFIKTVKGLEKFTYKINWKQRYPLKWFKSGSAKNRFIKTDQIEPWFKINQIKFEFMFKKSFIIKIKGSAL